jgi:hypothetical protein
MNVLHVFPASGRKLKEVYNSESLVSTVKRGDGSVVILAAIPRYTTVPIITLNGRITASDYVYILGNQVRPTVRMLFPKSIAVSQHDYSPTHTHTHSQKCCLGLSSMKMHFNIFPGQQNR